MLKKSLLIVFLLLSLFGVLILLRLSNPICPQDDVGTIKQSRFSVVANIGIEEARSEGGGPYQFSSILSADCDAEGNIYVLDYKDVCVKVFDKNGKFLRKILGPGQGPNEIENPSMRDYFTSSQRFVVNDATVWTCPGDFMELEAYDLKLRSTISFGPKALCDRDATAIRARIPKYSEYAGSAPRKDH